MAFDINSLNGLVVAADNIIGLVPSQVSVAANGNITIKDASTPAVADGNFGYPVAIGGLGLVDGDTSGYSFQPFAQAGVDLQRPTANQPIAPVLPVFTYQLLDFKGVPYSVPLGAAIVAYDAAGDFLAEQLFGFIPAKAPGTYSATTASQITGNTAYILFTKSLNADVFNPLDFTPQVSQLQRALPLTLINQASDLPASGVPLPSMGLTLGCLVLAVVVMRSVFGRASSGLSA